MVRSALRALLEAEDDLEVAGEAADAGETFERLRELGPDVLLLDLRMPGPGVVEVIQHVSAEHPGTAVVILTVETDASLVEACRAAGASGYVLKQGSDSQLGEAIRSAAAGRRFVGTMGDAGRGEASEPPGGLTGREAEVLGLLALGHTNPEIAEKLGLSVRTVESHRLHIQQKTGLTRRPELVRYALGEGLIGPPGA